MNKTREEKKIKAVELMKKLDIYRPYIKGLQKEDNVCFFENYGGYWAWQEPDLMKKVKEFEEEHNCLVYAITCSKRSQLLYLLVIYYLITMHSILVIIHVHHSSNMALQIPKIVAFFYLYSKNI